MIEVAIKDCDYLGFLICVCHVSLNTNLGIRRGVHVLIPDRCDLKVESFRIPVGGQGKGKLTEKKKM